MGLRPADPRFALAVNASAIARIFPEHLDGTIPQVNWNELAVTKALPHKSGGFVIQYCVPLETGGLFHIGGHLTGEGAARPDWAGAVPGSDWLPEPGLAVAIPSADPKLTGMERVLDQKWAENLGTHLGWKVPKVFAAETLAYRLEKRYVFRLRGGPSESAVIKVMRPRKLEAMVSVHMEALKSIPSIVPDVLNVNASVGALVMEDVPGVSLDEIGLSSVPRAYAAAGDLLRSYHRPLPDSSDHRSVSDELTQVREWIGVASRLHPDLAEAYRRAFKRLAASSPADDVCPVRLHRDFYDKQVMVGPDRITLLDLDTSTGGDPALDLGNFLAHIILRERQFPASGAAFESATMLFLDSYGIESKLAPRISWWRSAALLRLAAIYSFRPRWWHLTPDLLEDVAACLRKPELMI